MKRRICDICEIPIEKGCDFYSDIKRSINGKEEEFRVRISFLTASRWRAFDVCINCRAKLMIEGLKEKGYFKDYKLGEDKQ